MRKLFARTATAGVVVLIFAIVLGLVPARAEEVGRVGVDWIGNDIVIDAIADPEIEGVTCHVAYFDRSLIDRLQQGNWFEDPSNSSIDCVQTGPVSIGDINLGKGGEEVFQERRSLIFKTLTVKRIYDPDRNALIYLSHSRQVNVGSAKMSISVIPLAGLDVRWENGDPREAAQ